MVVNSTGNNTSASYKPSSLGNGFGVSIKLLSSGNNMRITQTFRISGTGKLYASYQHATSNISLADSQKFNISNSGYGGVFLFDNLIRKYYDGMGGVDISVWY